MSNQVRVAVIGTGSLGKEHARLYAELAQAGQAEFVGVFDAHPEAARAQAARWGVRAFGSVAEAAAASDALSVVTPTVTHHAIARELLEGGKHVLVEKPMTDSSEQAEDLVRLAQGRGLVLQVGHVERFNPVFSYLEQAAPFPKFIECHRLSPFPARSTDIGVVLDLMIHDLDVVMAFVKSPVVSVAQRNDSLPGASREDRIRLTALPRHHPSRGGPCPGTALSPGSDGRSRRRRPTPPWPGLRSPWVPAGAGRRPRSRTTRA